MLRLNEGPNNNPLIGYQLRGKYVDAGIRTHGTVIISIVILALVSHKTDTCWLAIL